MEELEIRLTGLRSGRNRIEVTVRNEFGLKSPLRLKDVYFIGLKFRQFTRLVEDDRITISWMMAGETYNAQLDLYRVENGDTTLIAGNVRPSVPDPHNYDFVPYEYVDDTIERTHTYRYFVQGRFTLNLSGGKKKTFVIS